MNSLFSLYWYGREKKIANQERKLDSQQLGSLICKMQFIKIDCALFIALIDTSSGFRILKKKLLDLLTQLFTILYRSSTPQKTSWFFKISKSNDYRHTHKKPSVKTDRKLLD